MSSSLNWSKRVPLEKIKRLYASDARGLLDSELLAKIGHDLYSRCSDIFEFWRACNGEVTCRQCGHTIRRNIHVADGKGDLAEILRCWCGWQLTWGDYLKRSSGHQLGASDVQLLVQHFIARWPQCKADQDKLLLIDWLIHQFHVKLIGMGNPFGINMLSGGSQEVLDFLNTLAYGDTATHQAEMRHIHEIWQRARDICQNNKTDLVRIAKRLGIKEASKLPYDALAEAILQAAPDEFQNIDTLLSTLTSGLRDKTIQSKAK